MTNNASKELKSFVIQLIIAGVVSVDIIVFVGRIAIVDGYSMAPTLNDNDVIIVESISRYFGKINSGDIVIMKIPELMGGKKKYAVKRVIATQGQHVIIADGKVSVDGKILSEGYINGNETLIGNSLYDDLVVPEGCVYVLGDNRLPDKSRDSRTYGPVNENRIIGKCWLRVFPLDKAGFVR